MARNRLHSRMGCALWLTALMSASAFSAESSLESWISSQATRSLDRIQEAISPSDGARGAVMASPSRSNPDYYAFWVRDAALVMHEVWDFRAADPKKAESEMEDYALLSLRDQESWNPSSDLKVYDPSGKAVDTGDLGIGEPKFNIDGSPYTKDWGRPQNDGPALRTLTLLDFAQGLLMSGGDDFVHKYLYRQELPAHSLIKADLEFISHHWKDSSFDLWEEVRGDHFYTRICQWRALDEGARFARQMSDDAAADYYQGQADAILDSLNKFWSGSKNYLLATVNQVGGHTEKASNLDIAIVLGVLHAGRSGSPFYVDDDRVIATVHELELAFDYQYAVNRNRKNDEGFTMAPGIGRYPEDKYSGYDTDTQGNPWFLATHAMAEYLLRLRGELKKAGTLKITDLSRTFYQDLVRSTFSTKRMLQEGDPSFEAVLQALQDRSDAYIRRSKFHTGDGGRQSEQFNRVTGTLQGAHDLTWSYASFLGLKRIRETNHD